MSVSEAPAVARTPPLEDPYVGLTPFTEEYVDFFFGRETQSSLVIGNLRAARLTLLYAESGVGKSSVLRAGVLARMHEFAAHDLESRGSPRLVPVVFSSWSERPVAALIHALGEAIRPYLGERDLPELPEDDLEAALEAASEALDATVLVILDQFEEYFLYPDEEPEEERVAAQIARCVNRPDLRANFLISIREDSYAQLGDLFRGKVKNVYGNFLHLDFLDRGGAREAIERPIERVNELRPGEEPRSVEPALVEAVLDQVGRDEADDRIETTYLQLVMRRLWEEERAAGSPVLRLTTLERLGGAQAIIGSHLDRAMEGGDDGAGLGREQRLVAAAAFRFLVTSGGTKIALSAGDLADLTGFPLAEVQPVLRHLSSPRLHILRPVVSDEEGSEPRYEIFHDALAEPIRKWRTGIEEEEREARAKRERAEKEEAQRAAAAAERQAQRERQRKRMALGALAVAVVALLVGVSIFALENKDLADQRNADNQSVRAAERIGELASRSNFSPAAAALASVEAYQLSPTSEARHEALGQLQVNPGMPRLVSGHTDGVGAVAYWPDSDNFVSGGEDATVRIWDADGNQIGSPRVTFSHSFPRSIAVSAAAADGTRIVAVGLASEVLQWLELDSEGRVQAQGHRPMPGFEELWGLDFSPASPSTLAVGGGEKLALLDLGEPERPRVLGEESVLGDVNDLAFADDGRSLLVVGDEESKELGVSASGFSSSRPLWAGEAALSVATAPDGAFAIGSSDAIELWDADRHRDFRRRVPAAVHSLAFAREGRVLVSGGAGWNATTWDVESGRPFGPPRATNRVAIIDLEVSPDGRTIAAAGQDRLVRLWPLSPSRPLARTIGGQSPEEARGPLAGFIDLAWDGGHRVAAASLSGTTIWSLRRADGESAPRPLARIGGTSFAVAYHGDILVTGRGDSFVVEGVGDACEGRDGDPCLLKAPRWRFSEDTVLGLALKSQEGRLLLASAGRQEGEGVLDLWDLGDVEEGRISHLSRRKIGSSKISNVTFSPASPFVAAATEDGKLRLWDVSDPTRPEGFRIRHAHGNENQPVEAIAFSPEGSWLATGGLDQQVVLWELAEDDSGRPSVNQMQGPLLQGQTVLSLAFSPDGSTLAAGDTGGIVCLYEVAHRRAIGARSCLVGSDTSGLGVGGMEDVEFIRLDGGGTTLLSAGTAQPIVAWNSILWSLSDADPVGEAIEKSVCALAGRNLTSAEWSSAFASTELDGNREKTCPEYGLPDAR